MEYFLTDDKIDALSHSFKPLYNEVLYNVDP